MKYVLLGLFSFGLMATEVTWNKQGKFTHQGRTMEHIGQDLFLHVNGQKVKIGHNLVKVASHKGILYAVEGIGRRNYKRPALPTIPVSRGKRLVISQFDFNDFSYGMKKKFLGIGEKTKATEKIWDQEYQYFENLALKKDEAYIKVKGLKPFAHGYINRSVNLNLPVGAQQASISDKGRLEFKPVKQFPIKETRVGADGTAKY